MRKRMGEGRWGEQMTKNTRGLDKSGGRGKNYRKNTTITCKGVSHVFKINSEDSLEHVIRNYYLSEIRGGFPLYLEKNRISTDAWNSLSHRVYFNTWVRMYCQSVWERLKNYEVFSDTDFDLHIERVEYGKGGDVLYCEEDEEEQEEGIKYN